MNNIDPRSLIGTAKPVGHWQLKARAAIDGQFAVTMSQYICVSGDPQPLYRVKYGEQQKDFTRLSLAQEEYQACVLHQWNCAGFND